MSSRPSPPALQLSGTSGPISPEKWPTPAAMSNAGEQSGVPKYNQIREATVHSAEAVSGTAPGSEADARLEAAARIAKLLMVVHV